MTVEDELSQTTSVLRLRVVSEADPGVLARLLAPFQNLNVIPLRVFAEFGSNDLLYVHIDITGIAESRVTTIACRLGQLPSVIDAYWHYI